MTETGADSINGTQGLLTRLEFDQNGMVHVSNGSKDLVFSFGRPQIQALLSVVVYVQDKHPNLMVLLTLLPKIL